MRMNRPAPSLSAFLAAARSGGLLQARANGPGVQITSASPGPALPVWPLFEAALADHFGTDIAALALRELGPRTAAATTRLAARDVLLAVSCAESQSTMTDALQQVLRMECSARLLGRRFCALCAELGLDPHRLPAARRQALDEGIGWHPGLRAAEAELRLRERLLALALH